jgi:hypothetical protein
MTQISTEFEMRTLCVQDRHVFDFKIGKNLKMIAFWDIPLCTVIEVNRRFRGAYCVHQQGETTRRYIAEGYHLHTRRRENLKSHRNNLLCSWEED